MASTTVNGIGLDAQTTAESLLFMTPYLHRSDPSAAIIEAAIAADPNTRASERTAGCCLRGRPIADSTVQSDLAAAIVSITNTVNSSSSQQPAMLTRNRQSSRTAKHHWRDRDGQHFQPAIDLSRNNDPKHAELLNWTSSHLSPVANGELQCVDLEYMSLNPVTTVQNGTYTSTLTINLPGELGSVIRE